ncbi:MAG: hypothetical protein ACLFN5_00845 [bacterium]
MRHGRNSYYRSRSSRAGSRFESFLCRLKSSLRTRHKSISPRSLLIGILVLVLVGTLCGQVVWRQIHLARVGYQITRLENENHELRMQVHREEVAVSRLRRLDRIQRIAMNQLGMTAADTIPVLEISRSQWAVLPPEGGRSP